MIRVTVTAGWQTGRVEFFPSELSLNQWMAAASLRASDVDLTSFENKPLSPKERRAFEKRFRWAGEHKKVWRGDVPVPSAATLAHRAEKKLGKLQEQRAALDVKISEARAALEKK